MKKLKGWKTITANLMILATAFGFIITGEEQTAIIGGIGAVVNIYLRLITNTPVGKSE